MGVETLRQRKKGETEDTRPVFEEEEKKKAVAVSTAPKESGYMLLILFVLAALVRLYRISQPSEVVFDEVHFGGYARKYIKGLYFMDVHPPLGKLLFAFVADMAGFDGNFKFKEIGDDYIANHVPYVAMRLLPGLLGVILVPVAYATLRNFGATKVASLLSALLLLFENGFITQSRLILLDSSLVAFTGLTVMFWSEFLTRQNQPFSAAWWYSLSMTGVFLGCTVSVKWVGLFLIATIGVMTLWNLWELLGDLRVSSADMVRHFFARFVCLLVIPIVLYMAFFQVHFMMLPNKGSGTAFMSAEFQSGLNGVDIPDTYLDVAFGSKVYIRHVGTNGGYLHSHTATYQTGSKQQQMTLYPYRDENSWFYLWPALQDVNGTLKNVPPTGFKKIKNGDIVRLEHLVTAKKIHSHDHRPPMSDDKDFSEVSGYGGKDFDGDTNDHWRVEITQRHNGSPYLKAIGSKFKLVHVNTARALFSHDVKLPEYGFGQQEVSAAARGREDLVTWLIEANQHPEMPKNAKKINYKRPNFFQKFWELHKVMWKSNAGLTSSHPYESRPNTWPLLRRGIGFWTKKDGGATQVYLLGNILTWYAAFYSLAAFVGFYAVYVLLVQRQVHVPYYNAMLAYSNGGGMFVAGWLFHYIPFFLMSRQLFLHHYFPALYFGILSIGVVFDMLTVKLRPLHRLVIALLIIAVAFKIYYDFAPFAYGSEHSKEHCEGLKWKRSWDFNCANGPKAAKSSGKENKEVKDDD